MAKRKWTTKHDHALQERFFTALREQTMPVRVFLLSGTKVEGTLAEVDRYALRLASKKGPSVIYKSAVAAIVPLGKLRLGETDEDGNRKTRAGEKAKAEAREKEREKEGGEEAPTEAPVPVMQDEPAPETVETAASAPDTEPAPEADQEAEAPEAGMPASTPEPEPETATASPDNEAAESTSQPPGEGGPETATTAPDAGSHHTPRRSGTLVLAKRPSRGPRGR